MGLKGIEGPVQAEAGGPPMRGEGEGEQCGREAGALLEGHLGLPCPGFGFYDQAHMVDHVREAASAFGPIGEAMPTLSR